ncbi:MAG: 4-hydroxy-3-methylbut-2-enyl diphosphate reductase [Elusimicrobia bacterium]|nr:4-hydroxy-3-methylbut-2-enyl diphosphate reductase [Elusimicrobiota bacterium]
MAAKTQITLASTAGFCPGVKNAIDKVLELAKNSKRAIYTLGPLIHNSQVIETLKEKNIHAVNDVSEIKDKNAIIVIRAHGIPPEAEKRLRAQSIEVVDATCPLVKHVHKTIEKYARMGHHTIIVGDKNHAEVVGLMGYAQGRGLVVSGPKEAASLPRLEKANIVAQTTQEEEVFLAAAAAAREKTAELVVSNTICKPTKDRQKETVELSKASDLVIVMGGKNSANTARLFQICEKLAPSAIHIEKEDELPPELLKDKKAVFITAGASTPTWMIEKALARVRELTGAKERSFLDRLSFIWTLAITSCAYTAAAAVALTYVCMKLEGAPISKKLLLLAGLFVLSLHLANRAEEKGTAAPDRAKKLLFIRFKTTTRLTAFLCGAAAIALAATLGWRVFLPAAFFWGLGMLYPYKLPLGFEKFGNFPASKDILTALGWGFVCACAPGIWHGSILYKSTHLAVLFAVLLVFMRSVMFGISHAHSDMIVGKENFYKAAGSKLTYLTLFAMFLFLEVIMVLLKNIAWKPSLAAAIFTGLFYYVALTLFFYFRKIPERITAETLIDSQFLILALSVWK